MQNKTGYTLVKEVRLSGTKASVYTVELEDGTNLFDRFLEENVPGYKDEVLSILQKLNTIAKKHGARATYFKLDEGEPGDGLCALYDDDDKNLRLYCIRYGAELIILGGGGFKPKTIRAFQQDDKLKSENYMLRAISKDITQRMRDKDISFDGKDFFGDLQFNYENKDE